MHTDNVASPAASDSAGGTQRMAARLEQLAQQAADRGDFTVGVEANLRERRRKLRQALTFHEQQLARVELGHELLLAGQNQEAVDELLAVQALFDERGMRNTVPRFASRLATAYLRLAEESNCLARHGSDSCLFPIAGGGVHSIKDGARNAIVQLRASLEQDPDNLADRWLLNIAHMTLGEYPAKPLPPALIDPNVFASPVDVKRFFNIAFDANVAASGLSGGAVMEDFDGDGDLDIMASAWGLRDQLRYFVNQGNGQFVERTDAAGLRGEVGGLNLSHADYDNDGDADVLVLRGAWLREWGNLPNSLLRNNGDGTFEDVTEAAGLLSLHPTQVGVWADFNNDGFIDLFIGNESTAEAANACELYQNNGDGSFTEVAAQAGVNLKHFVKGAAWGDFDNDGLPDLYVSQLSGPNTLFHNAGAQDGGWRFRDVTDAAGVGQPLLSFPTWFWDYDNDGWLDIFVGSFPGFADDTLADVAAGYLGHASSAGHPRLYRNNRDGTFDDVTTAAGLALPMLTMGANFGDIDNDGLLDMYLGTGEPNLRTLVPNRMYRNAGDGTFQNVTSSGGFGHLQKGHGVAFGDIDNDGDQDVYIVMGGAYRADIAYNALFENPGHDHHWITLIFEGTSSNRAGVGARVEISPAAPRKGAKIYATVGTGGSFGSSSLQQEIGLGEATSIETMTVHWPTSGITQTFHDVAVDQSYRLRENTDRLEPVLTHSVHRD